MKPDEPEKAPVVPLKTGEVTILSLNVDVGCVLMVQ